MSQPYLLEILTPDKMFFSSEVEAAILKTPEGEVGILKDHMAIVVAISSGPVRIKEPSGWRTAVVSEGFLEVSGSKYIVLCDSAEWPEEIDVARAQAAKERAEERLTQQLSKEEYALTKSALERAVQRLRAAQAGR